MYYLLNQAQNISKVSVKTPLLTLMDDIEKNRRKISDIKAKFEKKNITIIHSI